MLPFPQPCTISTAFCSISTAFCGARAGLVYPRPDSDSPMRCDAIKLTWLTNGQKNAAPAPRTPKRPQPGRVRHMLAAGACKTYHTVDVNHTCSAWRAAHTHTAQLSGRGGEHPWGFGIKRKRLLRLLFGLGTKAIVFRCKLCHSQRPHYENQIAPDHLLRRAFRQRGTVSDPIVI